jgi:hypothetical protein
MRALIRMTAFIGLALWAFAAVYVLTVVSSGFVTFATPNIYVTSTAVISGLVINGVLLAWSDRLGRAALAGLFVLSLVLSLLIVGVNVYMASDFGGTG